MPLIHLPGGAEQVVISLALHELLLVPVARAPSLGTSAPLLVGSLVHHSPCSLVPHVIQRTHGLHATSSSSHQVPEGEAVRSRRKRCL